MGDFLIMRRDGQDLGKDDEMVGLNMMDEGTRYKFFDASKNRDAHSCKMSMKSNEK